MNFHATRYLALVTSPQHWLEASGAETDYSCKNISAGKFQRWPTGALLILEGNPQDLLHRQHRWGPTRDGDDPWPCSFLLWSRKPGSTQRWACDAWIPPSPPQLGDERPALHGCVGQTCVPIVKEPEGSGLRQPTYDHSLWCPGPWLRDHLDAHLPL